MNTLEPIVVSIVYIMIHRQSRRSLSKKGRLRFQKRIGAASHAATNTIMLAPLWVLGNKKLLTSYGATFLACDTMTVHRTFPSPIKEMRTIHHVVTGSAIILANRALKRSNDQRLDRKDRKALRYWSNVVFWAFRMIEGSNVIGSADYLLRNTNISKDQSKLVTARLVAGGGSRVITLSQIAAGLAIHRLHGMNILMGTVIGCFVFFFTMDLQAGVENYKSMKDKKSRSR